MILHTLITFRFRLLLYRNVMGTLDTLLETQRMDHWRKEYLSINANYNDITVLSKNITIYT